MFKHRASGVFLNVPFDDQYEQCFVALIAGVAGMGLMPASVLEVSTNKQRLQRVFDLVASCRYSIHDLSRVQPSRGRYPRFNMPFEAGLASALALQSPKHERFLFEARKHRLAKTCSDLDGVDVKIHQGRPRGVLRAFMNAITRPRYAPRYAHLWNLYLAVRGRARVLKREAGTLYEAYPFKSLAAYAVGLAAARRGKPYAPYSKPFLKIRSDRGRGTTAHTGPAV